MTRSRRLAALGAGLAVFAAGSSPAGAQPVRTASTATAAAALSPEDRELAANLTVLENLEVLEDMELLEMMPLLEETEDDR